VTLTPATPAWASNVRQAPPSIQNQTGNPTSCSASTGGAVCGVGATSGISL